MPTFLAITVLGLQAVAVWSVIGFALGRRILPASLGLPLAPALGWACHSALALPFYRLAGMTRWAVIAAFAVPAAVAVMSLMVTRSGDTDKSEAVRVPVLAYGLAALLAVVPALAVVPKFSGEMVTLASPIFDHSKIALVDDIIRLGVPPGNPFFGESGSAAPLAYYYLWHFSAAQLALPFGASGWEAGIALTGFTAFASLVLMAGLATWISRHAEAALYVPPLAFAASLHPVLAFLFGAEAFYSTVLPPTGLAGWLFQTSWAPQHIAAASCVVLSCFLLARLMQSPAALTAAVLALTVGAGYQSSIWVGGILFGLASPPIVLLLLGATRTRRERWRAVALTGVAAVGAFVLVYPFVKAQLAVAAAREVSQPVALSPIEVFNFWVPDRLRPILDLPGYWLVLLPITFPAIYMPGLVALATSARAAAPTPLVREATRAFALLTAASLLVTGYLTTTFADNNDLGWRAVLPGVFVLTIFTAVGLARWLSTPRPLAAAATIVLFALSLPRSIELLVGNARGAPSQYDAVFAQTPAMWAAVRRHSAPDERVASNPLFLEGMTPWPVNISWALLADRRSCYAGHELALAFAPLSRARNAGIDRQFQRVFAGRPEESDMHDLTARFGCRVIVVTPQDGAWIRDPFAANGSFRLVEEETGRWRIYRVRDAAQSQDGR